MSAAEEPSFAAPCVVLEGLFVRDTAGPKNASRGALLGATAALSAGVHAFVGAPEDGTIALVDVLAGVRPPLRGSARVFGEAPSVSPSVRRRSGALLAAPDLPEARSVQASVEASLRALGHPAKHAVDVLSELGLDPLASRSLRSLSFAEARAVELAIAFAVVKRAAPPSLLLLFEPCADLALGTPSRTVADIISVARDMGACVVIATSSPADARRFADTIWVLHRGLVLRREPSSSATLVPVEPEMVVRFAVGEGARARAVAQKITEHPSVRAAYWEDPPEGAGHGPMLRVRSADQEQCALAVIDAAAESGAEVLSMAQTAFDLPVVRSAALTYAMSHRAPPNLGAGAPKQGTKPENETPMSPPVEQAEEQPGATPAGGGAS